MFAALIRKGLNPQLMFIEEMSDYRKLYKKGHHKTTLTAFLGSQWSFQYFNTKEEKEE